MVKQIKRSECLGIYASFEEKNIRKYLPRGNQITLSSVTPPLKEEKGFSKPLLLISSTIGGFIPICVSGKKNRDDKGYWQEIEKCIERRSDAHLSHSICPDLDISLQLSVLRARLEKKVTASLLIVQGLADFISVTPDLDNLRFVEYSKKALKEPGFLKNLTAAPDFKMRFVYPAEGNKAALGIDYRELPEQWEQALKAKETGKMVVAGPLTLVQGGTGLIGRAPVFTDVNGKERFWGIVSSVIDIKKLFDKVGLTTESNLDISIRGKDGKGRDGAVFFGDPHLFDKKDAVNMSVDFPAGSWLIAAIPKGGWSGNPQMAPFVHALIALFTIIIVIGVYRAERRNHTVWVAQQNLNQAQAIAATAKDVLRNVDILGRIGGEEFAVGLPETDLDDAMLAAERLRIAMEQTSVAFQDGGVVTFTVSLGVAVLDDSCKDVDALLKHADLSLYAAKEKGRNRVERYTPDMAG